VDGGDELIDRARRGMLGLGISVCTRPMSIESQLREKLRKIEALFAGASTVGERLAAEAALERVRARRLDVRAAPQGAALFLALEWSSAAGALCCRS
jgi:hypothetical protein